MSELYKKSDGIWSIVEVAKFDTRSIACHTFLFLMYS